MSLSTILLYALFSISFGQMLDGCYEGVGCTGYMGLCCPDQSSPSTTNEGTGTTEPGTTKTGTTGAKTTGTTETDKPKMKRCAHWTSNRAGTINPNVAFGPAGGAPLDVCFTQFSGVELTSTSRIYRCSADKKTVEYIGWTGTSDCNLGNTATTGPTILPFNFDPANYPGDTFECGGEPCPYSIIQDGTARPDETCPFDLGINYNYGTGDNDYATWNTFPVLQGCQSWGGTSRATTCSQSNGITVFNFNNPTCDFDGLIGDPNGVDIFNGGQIECNYGTGRAVNCRHWQYNITTTTETPAPLCKHQTYSGITSGCNDDTTTVTPRGSGACKHETIFSIFVMFLCMILNY